MITEDYCNFETAKLLKEKGFDTEIHMYWCPYFVYPNEGYLERCPEDLEVDNNCSLGFRPDNFECIAPTLQMAMKWLREVHNFFIQIVIDFSDGAYPMYDVYAVDLSKCTSILVVNGYNRYSYKQACDAAIKYCLENLI